MRHIGAVIAAVIVGPLAWILLALGQDRSAQEFANAQDGGAVDTNYLVRPMLLLAAAGILLGLITVLRLSPLGALLTGTFYVASGLGPLISPTLLNLLDHKLTLGGHQVDLATPVRTGTTLVLGSLLLVGVASVHRWRRWPRPAAEASVTVPPDEFIPAGSGPDHPLGADGLGLNKPGRAAEPELEWAGNPQRLGSPERAGNPEWAGSRRGGIGDVPWQSDPVRRPRL
jgi:hypothetical protein